MINALNKVDIYFPPTISQIIDIKAMNSNTLVGGDMNRRRQVTRTTTKRWLKCRVNLFTLAKRMILKEHQGSRDTQVGTLAPSEILLLNMDRG